MNLKEQLAEVKSNLEDLRPQVEAGDADAIKSAMELSDRFEQLEGLAKSAAKYDDIMGRIGKSAEPVDGTGEREFKSLGEKAAFMVKEAGLSPTNHGSVTVTLEKAAADPNAIGGIANPYSALLEEIKPELVTGPRRPLTIASLFTNMPTTKSSITYFVEGAVEGGPGMRHENGQLAQMHVGNPTKVTDPMKDVGVFWKDTDELLEDTPRLAANVEERADYLMDITEEDQIFKGDGTGDNVNGLTNRSGLQVLYYDPTSADDLLIKLKGTKKMIRKATPGFRADGIVINDEDWDMLTNLRDKNRQFLAGGPFYGMYGNTGQSEEPPIWGLRPVTSQATEPGLIVVGAWRLAGAVLRKGSRKLEVTNADSTDFQFKRVTFRMSEYIGLQVTHPAAFVKLKAATFAKGSGTASEAGVYYNRKGEDGAYVYEPVVVAAGASVADLYVATEIG